MQIAPMSKNRLPHWITKRRFLEKIDMHVIRSDRDPTHFKHGLVVEEKWSKKFVSRPSTAESASTYRVSPPDPKIGSSSGPTTPAPRSLSTTQPVREELKSPPKDQPMQSAFTSRTSQHEVWLKRKIEEERKRKAKQREEAINKEEQEKKRRENAEKLFEIWKRDRDKKEREARRQKSVKEKQEKEAEELLKRERKIEAEKSFEAWKRSHIRTRTSLSKDDAEKQRQKERNSKEAEKAFEAWKKSKDEAEHARRRELAEKEQTKRKQLKEEREYKELLAQQTYETWLELKENERFLAQSMASLNIAKPPLLPWLPASNTCPRQFTPSLKNK
ncbi:hypothetical protein Y032_0338g2930 [Ancylostoma ceylanicum]|nr:hypothetical protein Y032_0338g2930 [Ancylostoma ceylanicum]